MLSPLHLNDRVKIIPYQGKKVLHLDFSGITFEETEQITEHARPIIDKLPRKSIYTFSDFTGVILKPDIIVLVSAFAKANEPFVIAGAVVGLTATNRFILNTVNKVARRNLRSFDDPAAAREWLVQQL
jgi:hypothetical protein